MAQEAGGGAATSPSTLAKFNVDPMVGGRKLTLPYLTLPYTIWDFEATWPLGPDHIELSVCCSASVLVWDCVLEVCPVGVESGLELVHR